MGQWGNGAVVSTCMLRGVARALGARGAHLHPALAQRLLVTLAHVPVRREEPDHSGRVAHLLVAHAVVDELALAPVGRGEAPW